MASASGFLNLHGARKYRRRRAGEKIQLPSLPAPTTETTKEQQAGHKRPRSRGHTIHGTEEEIQFDRARQTLRLLNEDTPPSNRKRRARPSGGAGAGSGGVGSSKRERHRRTPESKTEPPNSFRRKLKRKPGGKGISSLLADVWSLQANKPAWMAERPPTTEPVVIVREDTPMEDMASPLPNPRTSPKFVDRVHQVLRLHPNASHLERSLLELHLQTAVGTSGLDTNDKVLSWLKHKYPLLLQRDRHRENKSVSIIGRAWRAYHMRLAFHAIVQIQRGRVAAAVKIQRWLRARTLRLLRLRIAWEMAPVVAVTSTVTALRTTVARRKKEEEEAKLDILHREERQRERLLREQTGMSKKERDRREKAARTIQQQNEVYAWRKKNNLFFMYQRVRHWSAKKIQTLVRSCAAKKELERRRRKREEEEERERQHVYDAAARIQRCWYRTWGTSWTSRMSFAVDVRDLLGADEDLPEENDQLVTEFFQKRNFGRMGSLTPYYTGGVFSVMGAFRPGLHLSEGERWDRIRQAQTTLASVYHSVGRLDLAKECWSDLVEGSLLTEWEARSSRGGNTPAPSDSGAGGGDEAGAGAAKTAAAAAAAAAGGGDLLHRLLERGPDRQLGGRTISYLVHLCLTYQCLGLFRLAERLLSNDILGSEYEKMMVKVRLANAYRRHRLLANHMEGWKEVCADNFWKRQRALRLMQRQLNKTLFKFWHRWSTWGRAVFHRRHHVLRTTWNIYRKWCKEAIILRRMMGDSHTHNVQATKRMVMRRWWYQAQEWRGQRGVMSTAFNHGRRVVLNEKLRQWKSWSKSRGKPWRQTKRKLEGLFYYWEDVVREHFDWLKRILFLDNDEGIEWGTRCLQKMIRGKWGRKKAKRQERVLALHRRMQEEHAENVIIWTAACIVLQRWYQTFLRQRRLQKLSIQIREVAETRRLRLRKLRLELQFYKSQIQLLGVEPYDHEKMKKRGKKMNERSKKVVSSSGKLLKKAKTSLQKVIVLFGEARVVLKVAEAANEVELEGKASKRTDEQIVKDIKRSTLFIEHEAAVKREAAYSSYRRRELFQIESKRKSERAEEDLKHWTQATEVFVGLDEEGQDRSKIDLLSKQWKDAASERITGLFRGRSARLYVHDRLARKKERTLLEFWGALVVQTTFRRHMAKKVIGRKRERRDFLAKHPRIIALAKTTGRPLGIYEQELKTVETMRRIGLTEERLEKVERKMKFLLQPWWKRRIENERYDHLPSYIQSRIPKRNRPLPPKETSARKRLRSFFETMHRSIPNFQAVHCPWKETTTATFVKMKLAIKLVNARARFREDGGVKHFDLYDLQKTILERGGSIIPAGKPTYFPKSPALSPQTWGIWKIPMEHENSEIGHLPRALDISMFMNGGDVMEDDNEDDGPSRRELYLQALMEDGIVDRADHGLVSF